MPVRKHLPVGTFMASAGPQRLRGWLRRRLSHLFESNATDGEIELVVVRLDWAFRDLPLFSAFAAVSVIANSCCTIRRMAHAAAS